MFAVLLPRELYYIWFGTARARRINKGLITYFITSALKLSKVEFLLSIESNSLILPYLGGFGTSTAWGGGQKNAPSIFPLFFKLCQNLLQGNNILKDLKYGKI